MSLRIGQRVTAPHRTVTTIGTINGEKVTTPIVGRFWGASSASGSCWIAWADRNTLTLETVESLTPETFTLQDEPVVSVHKDPDMVRGIGAR